MSDNNSLQTQDEDESALTPTELFNQVQALIPSSVMDRLIELGDTLTDIYWAIGDEANNHYAFCRANHVPADMMTVYAVIGRITGRSPRSVRNYAAVAAFFDAGARDSYRQLPFSHFSAAMTHREIDPITNDPGWKRVLNASMEYMDQYGVPPAADRLPAILMAQNAQAVGESWSPPVSRVEPVNTVSIPDIIDIQPISHDDEIARLAFENQGFLPPPEDAMTEDDEDNLRLSILRRLDVCLGPVPGLLTRLTVDEKDDPLLIPRLSQAVVAMNEALELLRYRISRENERLRAVVPAPVLDKPEVEYEDFKDDYVKF